MQMIGSALIVVSALLAIACVVVHQVLARWWESPYGRHVFAFEAVLAICLTLWAARLFAPDGNWFFIPRLIAFAGVPVVLAWRLAIIVRAWREERHRRLEESR